MLPITISAEVWQSTREIATFVSNLLSIILGLIALWALIFKRKKLKMIFNVVTSVFRNEKLRRIRETLSKLESLNYEEKQNRLEIKALLGKVSGQIKPMVGTSIELASIHGNISKLIDDSSGQLTETRKRTIVAELDGILENLVLTDTNKLLE